MKVRQLDIVKSLYQIKNLAEVAVAVGLSVDLVKEILQDIEKRLGEPIFTLEGDNLTPTPKGEEFYKFLKALPGPENKENRIPNSENHPETHWQRYSSVYEKSVDPITITDIDGTIIDCNPAALEIFGTTREKVLGRNNYIDGLAASEVDVGRQNSIIEEDIKKTGWYRFVAPILIKDELCHLEVIVTSFEDLELGKNARIWYGRDITKHIKLEEELQIGLMDADFTRQKVEDQGADLVAKADDLAVARDEAQKAQGELAEREKMLEMQIFELENARETLEKQSADLAGLADELSISKSEADEARDEVQKAYNTIESDLKAAEMMQRSLLPNEYAKEHGLICSNFYIPSAFLSGDIFNFFLVEDGLFCFYSVDVSGHGVPSALLSVSLSNLIRPGLIFREKMELDKKGEFSVNNLVVSSVSFLNSRFQMSETTSQYFTISLGILDINQKKLSICQAGHPSSILLRKSGEIEINSLGGVPVGFLEDAGYEAEDYDLKSGDRLYVYTDGITECENSFKEQFGEIKFVEFLEKNSSKPIEEVNKLLQEYLSSWRNKPEYGDDISLIAIEIE